MSLNKLHYLKTTSNEFRNREESKRKDRIKNNNLNNNNNLEKEQFEKEILEKEQLEKQQLEKERLEKEQLEIIKLNKEKKDIEQLEKEKLEKENLKKEITANFNSKTTTSNFLKNIEEKQKRRILRKEYEEKINNLSKEMVEIQNEIQNKKEEAKKEEEIKKELKHQKELLEREIEYNNSIKNSYLKNHNKNDILKKRDMILNELIIKSKQKEITLPLLNRHENNLNNINNTPGRLANQFFRNMAAHFLSEKSNLYIEYSEKKFFENMGIILHIGKNNGSENYLLLNDKTFFDYIVNTNVNLSNISMSFNSAFFQTKEFSFYLSNYINNNIIKNNIINHNHHKNRYDNNNDLFVHVRLGDLVNNRKNLTLHYEYYDKAISQCNFDKGYISSDSIDHEICKNLKRKYKLQVFDNNEEETIKFASTCKNIVLSHGTFSWLIGLLSFTYSKVFYADFDKVGKWHGDIFVFPDWICVNYEI